MAESRRLSYSLHVSLLVEIASRADVSLEAVVRVLTREPVSDADQARVLAVLDGLDAEQTRVLERFALAAVHDTLPRPQPVLEARVIAPAPLDEQQAALQAPADGAEPAPLVQLGAVLGELAEAVRELRRETDTERRERVDDLAVLIDLITKGWEGLDRRLGRLERQLARLDAGEPTSRVLPSLESPPVPMPPEPGPPEPTPPEPPPPDDDGRSRFGSRLPLVAALALGVGVGAVAALDLPSRSDVSTVVSASTREEPTAGRTAPSRPPTAPRTSSVLGEVATDAQPEPEPEPSTVPATTRERPATTTARPGTTAPATPSKPAPATTRTTSPRTTAAPSSGFRPSRTWAWPPVSGADYYLVEFFRAGKPIYRGRPTQPQLRLPASVAFTPGAYRWTVRAGFGDPAENNLQAPIVDSGFTVGD